MLHGEGGGDLDVPFTPPPPPHPFKWGRCYFGHRWRVRWRGLGRFGRTPGSASLEAASEASAAGDTGGCGGRGSLASDGPGRPLMALARLVQPCPDPLAAAVLAQTDKLRAERRHGHTYCFNPEELKKRRNTSNGVGGPWVREAWSAHSSQPGETGFGQEASSSS